MKRKFSRVFQDEQQVNKNLICPICHDVFNQPVRSTCGHTFCKDCIKQWAKMKSTCPLCRKYIHQKFFQKDIIPHKMIQELSVKCPQSDCDWTGSLESLNSHIKKCQHVLDCLSKEDPKSIEDLSESESSYEQDIPHPPYVQMPAFNPNISGFHHYFPPLLSQQQQQQQQQQPQQQQQQQQQQSQQQQPQLQQQQLQQQQSQSQNQQSQSQQQQQQQYQMRFQPPFYQSYGSVWPPCFSYQGLMPPQYRNMQNPYINNPLMPSNSNPRLPPPAQLPQQMNNNNQMPSFNQFQPYSPYNPFYFHNNYPMSNIQSNQNIPPILNNPIPQPQSNQQTNQSSILIR